MEQGTGTGTGTARLGWLGTLAAPVHPTVTTGPAGLHWAVVLAMDFPFAAILVLTPITHVIVPQRRVDLLVGTAHSLLPGPRYTPAWWTVRPVPWTVHADAGSAAIDGQGEGAG